MICGGEPGAQIIGLVGYAQSGKDEAANALAELGWTRVAFADPVREALLALNPRIFLAPMYQHEWNVWTQCGLISIEDLVKRAGWERAKQVPEVRNLLQRMGTEAGRNIHGTHCWINLALEQCERVGKAVISDCRFNNEAVAIKDAGGIVVKVTRPGVGPVNDHVSDNLIEQINADFELVNDGTLAEWHEKVRAFFEKYQGGEADGSDSNTAQRRNAPLQATPH